MMMHIGLFPFAVAWNLSTNRMTLQNSRRIRALIKEPTTKASKTKPPTKGKKSSVRWVAETTSELLVDDNQLVKQAQPIAKPDSRDYQVALAQAKAGFEQAKAQLAQGPWADTTSHSGKMRSAIGSLLALRRDVRVPHVDLI